MGRAILHRSRDVVYLNLKDEGDSEQLLELINCADALIEGFRPGVMERLGLGPDVCLARNQRLAYGRMTGWGQSGPLSRLAGHDINYLAITGALHAMGARRPEPRVADGRDAAMAATLRAAQAQFVLNGSSSQR